MSLNLAGSLKILECLDSLYTLWSGLVPLKFASTQWAAVISVRPLIQLAPHRKQPSTPVSHEISLTYRAVFEWLVLNTYIGQFQSCEVHTL